MTKVDGVFDRATGKQIAHAIWQEPVTDHSQYTPDLWRRGIGYIVVRAHQGHTVEWGWLLDHTDPPRKPRPGVRRMYFEALACSTCNVTFVAVPSK